MKLDTFPREISDRILGFLTNDGDAVVNLSMTSKLFHEKLSADEALWEAIVRQRWTANIPPKKVVAVENDEDDEGANGGRKEDDGENVDSDGRTKQKDSSDGDISVSSTSAPPPAVTNFRSLFLKRRSIDKTATQSLESMALDLQAYLGLSESDPRVDPMNPKLFEEWSPESSEALALHGLDAYDILKMTAAKHYPGHKSGKADSNVWKRLLSFLATKILFNFVFTHILEDWQQRSENEPEAATGTTPDRSTVEARQSPSGDRQSQLESAKSLEHCAFQICEIQRTPIELFQEKGHGYK
ncbi:MAG: hypothetical protein SGILL_000538, partial [Bacillariaceae sp.]